MNIAEAETRARIAVRSVQRGQPAEDDLLEMKREWPDPVKSSRQLAGLANRANGASFMYLIGVDERDGSVHPQDSTDPATWWAQVQKRFDEASPSLLRHLNIEISPNEIVTLMLFESVHAPYVVMNSQGGSPELEIPLRDGTRTRSAKRHEVLEMITQQQGDARVSVMSAHLVASWHTPQTYETTTGDFDERPEYNQLSGTARLFLEPQGKQKFLMPLHLMSGALSGNGKTYSVAPIPQVDGSDEKSTRNSWDFGTRTTNEGIVASGPGSYSVAFSVATEDNVENVWSEVDVWTLSLRFGVAGSSRIVQASELLSRGGSTDKSRGTGYDYGSWIHRGKTP